jgi:FMN phosphatase YigB (HAD superfamily)
MSDPQVTDRWVVVFDVGETLVDETRAWSEAANAVGITALTLFGALGALIERRADHRGVWDLLGVPRPSLTSEILASDLYPDVTDCLPGLIDAGFEIGLAGNQPQSSEAALARLGLPVSFIAASAAWGVEKPSPDFFERVIGAAQVSAERIAYVGDRLDNDVIPARNAGMFAVFLRRGPWGYIHAQWPEGRAADPRINSLQELPGVLSRWRAAAL